MAAAVKVYGPPFSTAVSRVLACLLEKDVPFHLLPVNMAKGEHKKPEYLKIQVNVFLFLVFLLPHFAILVSAEILLIHSYFVEITFLVD